ncbi:MAG TPA: flagellar FlbD family protein [Acidobacteriaceae bacterium]
MIELTRLNGSPLIVNSDLIQYAEAMPDTMLTLVTGEKLAVTETCAMVAKRALEWRIHVLQGIGPVAAALAPVAGRAAAATARAARTADKASRQASSNRK